MAMPLDEIYLRWLYSQIGSVRTRNPSRSYWALARQMFCKEFVWIIPNDDNRVEDGRALRYEFMIDELGVEREDVDPDWLGLGCSMLEMLIALSRRLAFQAEGRAHDWFWHLMDNIGLEHFSDAFYNDDNIQGLIDEKLDAIIWRTYDRDGGGGLFPLRHPDRDQRDVEIWYQMSAYIIERD